MNISFPTLDNVVAPIPVAPILVLQPSHDNSQELGSHNMPRDDIPLADPCVYRSKLDDLTLLGIFVNDGLICYDNPDKLDAIMFHVSIEFKVSQGDDDYYVGFEVIHRKETWIVFLHQTRYITEVLKRFYMIDCNHVSTPVA